MKQDTIFYSYGKLHDSVFDIHDPGNTKFWSVYTLPTT